MLDFRYETFLELCKTRNYTKAAKNLHVSQPTVTQHIHHLENVYRGKLFVYDGKALTLTKRGELLLYYTQKLAAESRLVKQRILATDGPLQVFLGATCTMGEFVLPPILGKCMEADASLSFNMIVEYRDWLLQKLVEGKILIAYCDGEIDSTVYSKRFFSQEKLAAVCSPNSPLCAHPVTIHDLLEEKLLIRETGIDSRICLENALSKRSMSLSQFSNVQEICNISAIKQLVERGIGITFLYESTVRRELQEGRLSSIAIRDFDEKSAFNFVYLRDTNHEDLILSIYKLHKDILSQAL